ncbi:hypothetical protein V1517DRAFT_316703 [Lipomyces orientalis]|uniref:Uncharacterized protein n=1 Tax=Lipomyces orientalis TaxID=1233043 RepID=A0ACC3TX06_9ASCO
MDSFFFRPDHARDPAATQHNDRHQLIPLTALYSHAAAAPSPSPSPSPAPAGAATTVFADTGNPNHHHRVIGPFTLGQHRRRSSASRTRTGCWTCRLRRKKCTEEKPACAACLRLKLACDGYGDRPDFMKSADAMGRKRDEIRTSIRAFKGQPVPQPADDESVDAGSGSGSVTVSVSAIIDDAPKASRSLAQSRQARLPAFFDVALPTVDLRSPSCPQALLSHYVRDVPPTVFAPALDHASQLVLAVVYFRLAARLLHPALFLHPDSRIDFGLLLYDASVADPAIWRSVCAIASVYASVALHRSPDPGARAAAKADTAAFVASAHSLLPTRANEDELERVMLLGWNLHTLCRLLRVDDRDDDAGAALHALLNLTSRFGLLRSQTSPLLRVLAAYVMHADVVVAATTGAPAVLSATYADMLAAHLRGAAIFGTADTGVPVATPLLVILSRIVDLQHEADAPAAGKTDFVLKLESVSAALDNTVLVVDRTTPATAKCSRLFRLSVRAYMSCFIADHYMAARASSGVRETVIAFCTLLASDFLVWQDSLARPDALLRDSVAGQELERCILWSLTFIGSISPPGLLTPHGPCRDIIQRVFESAVSLAEFGSWTTAWRVVCTCWRDDVWTSCKSFRDVLRDRGSVVM